METDELGSDSTHQYLHIGNRIITCWNQNKLACHSKRGVPCPLAASCTALIHSALMATSVNLRRCLERTSTTRFSDTILPHDTQDWPCRLVQYPDAKERHRPVEILNFVAVRWWAGARQKPAALIDLAVSMVRKVLCKVKTQTRARHSQRISLQNRVYLQTLQLPSVSTFSVTFG